MSYASSAGSHGKTCRQDVLRRIDVPVVPGAAGRACPVPRVQAQLRKQVPARRAGLGGGVPAVDHDQHAPGALALVLKLAAELAPAAIGDRAGQPPVRTMPDTFRSSMTMCLRSGPAGCWHGAGSPAARRGPCGGRGRPSPWPWPGSPSPSGSGPGAAGSGPGCAPCAPGDGDWRSSPRSLVTAKPFAPRSTPTACPALRQGAGGRSVNGEGHIPAAVRLPGHDHHRRVQRDQVHVRPGPGEAQRPACLGQLQHRRARTPRPPPTSLPSARLTCRSTPATRRCPPAAASPARAESPRSGCPPPRPPASSASPATGKAGILTAARLALHLRWSAWRAPPPGPRPLAPLQHPHGRPRSMTTADERR